MNRFAILFTTVFFSLLVLVCLSPALSHCALNSLCVSLSSALVGVRMGTFVSLLGLVMAVASLVSPILNPNASSLNRYRSTFFATINGSSGRPSLHLFNQVFLL